MKENKKHRSHVYNGNGNFFPKTICPYCWTSVANGDPEKVFTVHGWAHYNCALTKAIEKLQNAGIKKKPKEFGFMWQFKNFLIDITEEIWEKEVDEEVEQKMKIILSISEEMLREPLKLSTFAAEMR